MSATMLPPSGDVPERPGGAAGKHAAVPAASVTCDASGMEEIHRMFRAGFGEGPDLVAAVSPGDVAHAGVVADHLTLLSTGLHAHHEGEDAALWSKLEERAPACAAHVARMKSQHAEMLIYLEALDEALPAWRSSASMTDAAPVRGALDGVNAALAVHLGDEEANIVPVMETTLTQEEVDWFGEHGRRATPKGAMFLQLGAILAAQPDGGDEWQHKHLPAPVRVIWRVVGKRKYLANRAALEGSAARR
ncbi:hemerythrin domain-containing protein [Orlajensenia leifsoniae]|uniref:Hemerythrin domain-containing protein n=1 Tax=Orlajensenia leifsoniae TaxID=2561933 RepID=A0A4Y9QSM0_9MICO|nr:hemerythrin domain-containing protein [Leifsonia flava]TFV95419.1 hemerythrin domain-containing protein [Leifsonia flava]